MQDAKHGGYSHMIAAIVSRRENEASKSQATAKVKLTEAGRAAVEDPSRPITKKTAEVHPLTAVNSQLRQQSVLDTQCCFMAASNVC